MKILGIDTSSTSLSLAITEDKLLKSEYTIHHKLTHSEQLMPAMDYLLQSLGYQPDDLDAIGVCIGPGSFTGIRIGIAAANAMGLALGIPVIGISSLEAMAYGLSESGRTIFATLDAQRDRVYRGAYTFREGFQVLYSEDVIPLTQLLEEMEKEEESILLGDGIFMVEALPENTRPARKNQRYIRASEVCLLTEERLKEGVTSGFPRPIYLRKSQAEVQFEERLRDPGRYQVKEMNKENLDGAYDVEVQSFTVPWSKNAFQEELKNPKAHYRVIQEEKTGKVVAFGGFWKILDEGHICNIAVHPEYRGLGIGNRIVEALVEMARENAVNQLTLEVRASNEKAKKLYEKYGFKIGGIRKEYYFDNREDAIIMWWKESDNHEQE